MCVYSDDGCPEGLYDVGCIGEATGVLRVSGETDLIICNKMNATVGSEFGQLAQG